MNSWSTIETAVETQIQDNTGQTMTATGVSNADSGGVPMIALQVQGDIDWLFFHTPLGFGPTFEVNRTVTFRDEGR